MIKIQTIFYWIFVIGKMEKKMKTPPPPEGICITRYTARKYASNAPSKREKKKKKKKS